MNAGATGLTRRSGDVPWRAVAVFVVLAFGMAWSLDLICALTGGLGTTVAAVALVLQMLTPAAASWLVCRFVTHQPWTAAVGLSRSAFRSRGWLRILGWATVGVVAAFIVVGLVTAIAIVVGWMPADWTFAGAVARVQEVAPGTALPPPGVYVAVTIVGAFVAAYTINGAVALGEELGWRGWLLGALAPLGRVRAVLATGAVWGLWHAPLIAMGYEYNHQIPTIAGVALFTCFAMAVGTGLAWLRVRSASVLPCAVAHGAVNGAAGIPSMLLPAGATWAMATSSLVGVIGVLLLAGLAAVLLARASWTPAPGEPSLDLRTPGTHTFRST